MSPSRNRLRVSILSVSVPWAIAIGCLLLGACVFADQSGKALPHEVYQLRAQKLGELSFHFRTGMNYFSVFARMALVVGALLLLHRVWRSPSRQLPLVAVLVVCSAASAWFFASAAARVWSYKISVDESGLAIHIPFQADIDEPWDQVWGVTVRGKEWREGGDSLYTEWSTMKLRLSGGREISVDLQELGVVQRAIFMRALEHRSKMKALEYGVP